MVLRNQSHTLGISLKAYALATSASRRDMRFDDAGKLKGTFYFNSPQVAADLSGCHEHHELRPFNASEKYYVGINAQSTARFLRRLTSDVARNLP
jgi:hypothetical protein